jgi:penicillin-binding protein 2
MRNQPRSTAIAAPSSGRRVDRGPARMRILLALMAIPLVAVGWRVWYLQAVAADRFVVRWDHSETVVEPISARDGRILSADGLELAFDRTRFDLAVHYRWIEEPPDPQWLRDQARSKLPRADRRNAKKIAAAEAALLQERDAFWKSFVKTSGMTWEECQAARGRIQTRIERMAAAVEDRRARREAEAAVEAPADVETERPASFWIQGWRTVVRELTTPPPRESPDPIILKEELDYHTLAKDVAFSIAAEIQSAPATFPSQALTVRTSTQRVYPANELASHIIGVRRDSTITADNQADSRPRVGTGGIEQAYDAVLRGRGGLRRVVYNRRREIVRSEVIREPVDGTDVMLTFDAGLQRAAERILDEALVGRESVEETSDEAEDIEAPAAVEPPQGATLIALDISTGEILAAAAAPRFDLSLLSNFDEARWQETMADPRHPFFPRVTALSAPPGSVFKVLTAVAALESSAIDAETPLHCRGYLDRPDQLRCMIFRQHGASHGDVTLADALCQSCNVYFFQAARTMGPEPLRLWSERFGFGAPTGVDLPGEAAGKLPPAPSSGERKKASGTTLQFAIGQSSLLVSPLQVARMMAAVANGGKLVTPRFVRRDATPSRPIDTDLILAGYEETDSPSSPSIPDLSPRTLAIIREGLRRVVDDPHGTGKSARVKGVPIAGKTGTAETGGGQADHAWFAGYVPADRPRIAFVVMLEHAGSGGKTAGPVARQFVEALIEAGRIRPSIDPAYRAAR